MHADEMKDMQSTAGELAAPRLRLSLSLSKRCFLPAKPENGSRLHSDRKTASQPDRDAVCTVETLE